MAAYWVVLVVPAVTGATQARNMAIEDAAACSKICVQMSDDIRRWEVCCEPLDTAHPTKVTSVFIRRLVAVAEIAIGRVRCLTVAALRA